MKKLVNLFFILFFISFVNGGSTYGSGNFSSGVYVGVLPLIPSTPEVSLGGDFGTRSSALYKLVCSIDDDCLSGKKCVDGACIKLFDLEIVDFNLVLDKNTLEFSYFLDSWHDSNDLVIISYWIEKDGVIVFSDSSSNHLNELVVGENFVSLDFPSDFNPGIYDFNMMISYGSLSSKKKVTFDVELYKTQIEELFDINFRLDNNLIRSSSELYSIVELTNFGTDLTSIILTYSILNDLGIEVYRTEKNLSVLTDEFVMWDYGDLYKLPSGKYSAVLETIYSDNVYDKFTADFEIVDGDFILYSILQSEYILYSLLLIILIITLFVIVDFLYSSDNEDFRHFKILNNLYLKYKYLTRKIIRRKVMENKLIDVSFGLDNKIIYSVKDLFSIVTLITLSKKQIPIFLNFSIINSDGTEFYKVRKILLLSNIEIIKWNYLELNSLHKGKYTAVLEISYLNEIYEKFTDDFEVVDNFNGLELKK